MTSWERSQSNQYGKPKVLYPKFLPTAMLRHFRAS
jgi:hypothetical protein